MQTDANISIIGSPFFKSYINILLSEQGYREKCTIISTYIPGYQYPVYKGYQYPVYKGLNEAVKIRLSGNFDNIILTSFLNKEKCLPADTHSILSLRGTCFIPLPVTPYKLISVLKDQKKISPKALWRFRYETGRTILIDKYSQMKHGGHFEFRTPIIWPLQLACENAKKYGRISDVANTIKKAHSYLSGINSEFLDIASFFKTIEIGDDHTLKSVLEFAGLLESFKEYTCKQVLLKEDELNIDEIYQIVNDISEKFYT